MEHPIEKDIAANIIETIQRARNEINEAELLVRSIEDEGFREKMKTLLGRSSLDLYSNVMGQLILIYPELDPYEAKV